MDKVKQWVALTVVGVLAILAGGWFLLVSPKKSDATDLNAQATAKQAANAQLVTQLAMLKAQAKDLPRQQAALAAVAAKVPDNPAMPALIRAMTKAAADAGVELVSISPGTPTAVAAPVVARTVTPTTTGAPAGAAAVPSSGAGSAAAGTLNSITVAVNVVGGYFQIEQFVDGLESLTRAFKVSTLGLQPGPNPAKTANDSSAAAVASGRSLNATIGGLVYTATGRITTAAVPTTAK